MVESLLFYYVGAGRQKSTYTVTGLGGRTEDIQIIGNGTLVIWRVALSDQGEYTCAASNDVGESISKTVNLKINGKQDGLQLTRPQANKHYKRQSFTGEIFQHRRGS